MGTIETDRLVLRPFTYYDQEAFALIGSDPDVMRFIGDGKPQSCDQTADRLNTLMEHHRSHGFGLLAAVDMKYYAITRDEYERENPIGGKKRRPQFD